MINSNDREDILYSYSIEETHDQETLERYLREYPELADDLIDLSSELRLSRDLGPSTAVAGSDKNWKAAFDEFLACGPKKEAQTVVNPFALFRGKEFVKLVNTLNVSHSFLTAFRDGLVAAASIPEPFLRRLAQATGSTIDNLLTVFASPQLDLTGRAFKSDQKPTHQGQKTFEELIRISDMTEEQQQILLRDIRDDGRNRSSTAKG